MSLTPAGHELAQRLLLETREELGRADGKAQILLASSGVVIGVVLGGIIGGDWSPVDLSCPGTSLWWAGVGSAALAIGALGFAIFPRLTLAAPGRVTYFEDVRRHEDCASLLPHLNSEAERGERDAEQLLRLSRIAHRKYRAIQVAIGALLAALMLCIAGLIWG
jgi:hypothetical protein